MKAKGLVWMGVPTHDFADTVAFFRDVMGLKEESGEGDFAILRLPGGQAVEVFGLPCEIRNSPPRARWSGSWSRTSNERRVPCPKRLTDLPRVGRGSGTR